MKHFAGLDVSVKETSIFIVNETGKICREMKVICHPDDLADVRPQPADAMLLHAACNEDGDRCGIRVSIASRGGAC